MLRMYWRVVGALSQAIINCPFCLNLVDIYIDVFLFRPPDLMNGVSREREREREREKERDRDRDRERDRERQRERGFAFCRQRYF